MEVVGADMEKFKNNLPKATRTSVPIKSKKRVIKVRKQTSLEDLIKAGELLLHALENAKQRNVPFLSFSHSSEFTKYSKKFNRVVLISKLLPMKGEKLDQVLHHLNRVMSLWTTNRFSTKRALYYSNTTLFKENQVIEIS